MRLAGYVAVVICGLAAPALAQQPPAVPVGTVKAERKLISKTIDFVGRVEAINRVEIRARVKGYLEAIVFAEGDLITENAPLYRIEKGLFQAAVEQAQGALESSQAQYVLAVKNRERQEELFKKNVSTAKALEEAIATEGQAKGTVMTNEANLLTAKINLGYTDIAAPISGKIGRTNVTKGNVVGPDSGALTMIVSQDPMYVIFPVSQRDFLRAQQSGHPVDTKNINVRIRYANGAIYDQAGRINFVDVSVDPSTDTVLVRASFPNPAGGLIAGQLVRVLLESGAPEEKVVIPQAALIADQEGVYVFVVEDGKAVVKRLKLGSESGGEVVVEAGLSGGELVIVEGLQSVRPGLPVRAHPIPASVGGN